MSASKAKLQADGLQSTIGALPPSPQKAAIVAELATLQMEIGFSDEMGKAIQHAHPLPLGRFEFAGNDAKKQEWLDYWAALDQHKIDTAATLPVQPDPLPDPEPAP